MPVPENYEKLMRVYRVPPFSLLSDVTSRASEEKRKANDEAMMPSFVEPSFARVSRAGGGSRAERVRVLWPEERLDEEGGGGDLMDKTMVVKQTE